MDKAAVMKEAIVRSLASGVWRAGHRMPTERELSRQYGIGRTAVRRVLTQLKAQQLIRQTVGSGTYVRDDLALSLARQANDDDLQTSPSELMQARLVLEPAIVQLVIGNASSADFARMEECCTNAEAALRLDEFEHWDSMLHEIIADAAHNVFVLTLSRTMSRARSQAEWGLLKRRSVTPERRLEYQLQHRDIVNALRDRDLSRATTATRDHLLHVWHNLLGTSQETPSR
jgi:DNA-binding FadR family transcriptional regulator